MKCNSKFIGFVYKYTNKTNGKVYIGETLDLEKRKKAHLNQKGFSYFHKAIQTEGINNFEFEILFQFEDNDKSIVKDKIIDIEEFHINIYESYKSNKGYNYCRGAKYTLSGPFWDLTKFDNQISNTLKDIEHLESNPDVSKLDKLTNRLTDLKQKREILKIQLGAKY